MENNNNSNHLQKNEKGGGGKDAKIDKKNSMSCSGAGEPNPSWFEPVEHTVQALNGEAVDE